MHMRLLILSLAVMLTGALCLAEGTPKSTDKLPFLHVDVAAKRVAIDCETVAAQAPLEFFCVTRGGPEHETIFRTDAKPSHVHLALLMLGLTPGQPVHYSEAADKWLPPHGPPLQISVQYQKDGKTITFPAWKLMRDIQSKKTMPPLTWIFTGSKLLEGDRYGADDAGYVVSIVNFDLCPIDVPMLASSSNDLLEYELNPDTCPPEGSKATIIIEPAGGAPSSRPATAPISSTRPAVSVDQEKLDRLREQWQVTISSRAAAMQQAAVQHYQTIQALRAEQSRLVDEADRIGRLIEELERDYQNLTTPRPATRP